MTQYLLSIYHSDDIPPAGDLEVIMKDVAAVNDELQAAGAWVFAGGLHPSTTATVVRATESGLLTTDGPYIEAKEHIGGFWLIEAPDLDAALTWAGKATRACRLPVEVRPLQDVPPA
jgi:hypothetical protein